MANSISPRGFVPSRYKNGSPFNMAVNMYYVPSTDGTQLSPGDAVKSAAGGDSNGIPAVTKAANTDAIRGVLVGVLLGSPNAASNLGSNLDMTVQNIPATKARDYYVLVVDDPNVLFELQDDGASALTAAACNKNASFTVANPTAPQQNSASALATASVDVTNTLPLKLFGLVQAPNNSLDKYAKWLVMFNKHELQGGTAGV